MPAVSKQRGLRDGEGIFNEDLGACGAQKVDIRKGDFVAGTGSPINPQAIK